MALCKDVQRYYTENMNMRNKMLLRFFIKISKTVCLFILITMVFLMCGCEDKQNSDTLYIYDWGETAKDFALQLFENRMHDEYQDNFTLENTYCGFNVSSESETAYVVVFHYVYNENNEKYGYMISVNQLGQCNLLDEGSAVADLLFDPTEE